MATEPTEPVVMSREDETPNFRYFRAGKADFTDDNTFQVCMSSEFPAEQRATKEHEKLGIAKAGEKYVEILSHDEGDVDLSRFVGENRAPLLDEHKDNRHLGYIKDARLSTDKHVRGVIVFDQVSKLSKTRCAEVRADSRRNFSIGYAHTRYLGSVKLDDGRTGHRFAWAGLELSNVAVPADPGAQKGRSAKNQECSCIACGDRYARKDLNDEYVCADCAEAESPADETERKAGERQFRAKSADKEFCISHGELRRKVDESLNGDTRFKSKRANGDVFSDYYLHDVHQLSADGNSFQAVVSSPAWRDGSKLYAVDFSYDGSAVTLGERTHVEAKTTLEAVERAVPFDAKQFRSIPEPESQVDSQTLQRSAQAQQPNLTPNIMPKTAAELAAENPDAVAQIRSEAEKSTRSIVLNEINTKAQKVEEANKEVRARANDMVKTHGMKWVGKPGEVQVVADVLRKIESEICAMDDSHDAVERRTEFSRRAMAAIEGARAPLNQQDAAALPFELAGRCSLRRLYNAAAEEAGRGNRTSAFRPKDGAEAEADKELRNNAKNFPGGEAIEMAGVQLPVNMPARQLNLTDRQLRRMTRDALAGDFASSGALIAPDFRFPTIELLRNKMALGRAGITILGGAVGNIVLPRQTGATTSQSVAEGAILAAYDQTFDQVKLTPHRIGSKQNYSRLALLQAGDDFEALVINDHMAQNALRADYLVLNGSGGNDEPVGILNQPGIGAVVFAGSAANAYKNIIALETAIRKSNIDEAPTYITTSAARGTLRITPATLTGSTVVSGQTQALWVGEQLVGRDAVDSQQVPGDILLALVGRHVVMAQWGGWQVVLDTLTLADADKIKLSMNTYIDSALRHPQAVARSVDSLAVLA